MANIEISIPSEPMEIKAQILEYMKRSGSGSSGIDWDSLALWYGNPIPSYLWKNCGWKNVLSKQGFTWQKFLKKMKYRTEDALLWVKGSITWEDFAKKVIESIDSV